MPCKSGSPASEAVRSQRLVRQSLRVEGGDLLIGNEPYASPALRLPLASIRRIVVVGAGKAGAGMAAAVEEVLGPKLLAEKQLAGWVNVPADCVRPLRRIHLHAARPAGVNEPTPERRRRRRGNPAARRHRSGRTIFACA